MRGVKLIFISVMVLFLLLVAFSSLLPSEIRISRAIDIIVQDKKVRAELVSLNKWEQWNEFIKVLNDKHIVADSIVSTQLIISMKNYNVASVTTWWVQQNGKSFPAVFNIIDHDSITTLQWYFEFKFKWYPWEKLSSIVYDKQLGPQMEQSLLNLKQLLEKAE